MERKGRRERGRKGAEKEKHSHLFVDFSTAYNNLDWAGARTMTSTLGPLLLPSMVCSVGAGLGNLTQSL